MNRSAVAVLIGISIMLTFCLPVFAAGLASPLEIYPQYGQGPEQQDRDRYECHCWAVSQTGYDPYHVYTPPPQRASVVPVPPPGRDTAVLGFSGALMGALAAGPRHAGAGAIFGGITGAFIGAFSDSARQERAREIEDAYDARQQAQSYRLQRGVDDYRRAMSACLEGRGYCIK